MELRVSLVTLVTRRGRRPLRTLKARMQGKTGPAFLPESRVRKGIWFFSGQYEIESVQRGGTVGACISPLS